MRGKPDHSREALTLLAVGLVLAMTTWFSATAVAPQLRAEWDLTRAAASWLTIAVQLGFVVGAIVSSLLNLPDVLSARALILSGAVGAALANVGLLFSDGPVSAVIFRAITGAMLAGVYPPALKLMATWFPRKRGVALGILVGALTLGSATPHLVNGVGGLDWHVVVVVTSLLTLAGGVVAFSVHQGPHPFPQAVFDMRQAPKALANRGVRLASLGYFGHMWELYAMWAWFAVFFRDVIGANGTSGVSASYAAFAVIGIGAVGCWFGGVLGDRWGRTRTTAASMAVSGTCAVIIGFLVDAPPWLVLVVGLVWGFSVVADSAQFSTMVTELADQAYVGTALTLQLAIGFTLIVATVWLVPQVESASGWGWAFVILAPGPVLGVIAMLRLKASPEAAKIAGGLG